MPPVYRSRRCSFLALGALGICGCAASAAAAAAPWSEPNPAVVTHGFVGGYGILYTPNGAAVLHWGQVGSGRVRDRYRLLWRDSDGRTVREQSLRLRRGEFAMAPVQMSAGRYASLFVRDSGKSRSRLGMRFLDSRGLSGFRRLVSFREATDRSGGALWPAIASDGHSSVAVAWTETKTPGVAGSGRERIRFAIRRPGRRFRGARTVARRRVGGLGPVALAFDGRGRLLIAYAATRKRGGAATMARILGHDGRLSPARVVGPADPTWGTDLRAAAGTDGTMAVAWGSLIAEECLPAGSKQVYAAVRPAGARTFRPAERLAAGDIGTCESRTVDLVVGSDGRTTVAWALWEQPHERSVEVAEFDRRGAVSSRQRVGSGDFGDLAVGPDGTVIVTWDDGEDPFTFGESPWPAESLPEGASRGRAHAALRRPDEDRFANAELVSSDAEDASPPAAAFHPLTGHPVLVWWSYSLTGNSPTSPSGGPLLHTAIRAAP